MSLATTLGRHLRRCTAALPRPLPAARAGARRTLADAPPPPKTRGARAEPGEKLTAEEAAAVKHNNKLADAARSQDKMWGMLVPERNMGLTSPFFWVMLAAIFGLHQYNGVREEEAERLREAAEKRYGKKVVVVPAARDPTELAAECTKKLVFKRKQLQFWEGKRKDEKSAAAAAAATTRLAADILVLEGKLREAEARVEARVAELAAIPAFAAAGAFEGGRDGCVFKMGDAGLGYYRDL